MKRTLKMTLIFLASISLIACSTPEKSEITSNDNAVISETIDKPDKENVQASIEQVKTSVSSNNIKVDALTEKNNTETIEKHTEENAIESEETEIEETETTKETTKPVTKSSNFPFGADRDISQPYLNRQAGKWVILDVDMNTDVDDVCAVRMATALDELGVIDLKAVCYCTDYSSYGALRGILHHDGKDDVLMGQGTEDRHEGSPYWNELGKHNDFGGNFESSVRQYRKVLASATSPVDIVTTGQITNLEALLKSGADDISPLTGKELVMQKVGQLYVAGGDYPNGWSNNLALTNAATIATKYVSQNWELPIIWSPGNFSGQYTCGGYLQDLDTSRKDPVSRALDAWGCEWGRAAWDPYLVWVCGYGAGEVNQVELQRVTFGIQDGGANWFVDGEGKDYIVKPVSPDKNYYNQTLDNHLIYMYTKIYGVENPNKEPIGLSVLK